MTTGQQAAQAGQAAGIHRPGCQQLGAYAQAAAVEAYADAGRHDRQDAQREPRDVALLRHRLQLGAQRRRCLGVGFQVACQTRQVAGSDHCQHFALARVVFFAQAGGHVAVALADDGFVQRRALACELTEARFQHVALLELLDLVLAHFLGREQAGAEAGNQLQLAEEAQPLRRAAEGQANLAVDQVHRQVAFAGEFHRTFQLGTGLDVELLGQATLIGGQSQVGGEQGDAALADHLDQVELGECVGVAQRLQALRVQLDGNGIEAAAVDGFFNGLDAGAGDVGGAQQGVAHAVAFDDAHRLAGEQVVAGLGKGFGHGFIHWRGRCRRHRRARAASVRCPASGHACGRGHGTRPPARSRSVRAA